MKLSRRGPENLPRPDELLDRSQSAQWDDASVPLGKRGIRLSWLSELIHSVTWYANSARREALEAEERAARQRWAADHYDGVPYPDDVHVPEVT
jgi:hypothetical protein